MIENLKELKETLNCGKEDLEEVASKCVDTNSIIELCRSKGVEVSQACAERIFDLASKKKAISEDELATVTGGGEVQVENYICPSCGGITGYTKEGRPIVKQMKTVRGDFDCQDHFYWEYQCPACDETFYFYVNDGYWID